MNQEEIHIKEQIGRREFIKGALALGLMEMGSWKLGGGERREVLAVQEKRKSPPSKGLFQKRLLGNTGLKVSSLGMGQALEPSLYIYGIDRGMNIVESSRGYRGGTHEEIIGEVLKKVKRDRIIIVTKISNDILREYEKKNDYYEGIMKSADLSLKALRTDYIDVLLGHGIDSPSFLANESVKRAFSELKKSGKIRFCGVSTHKAKSIIEWIIQNGFYDVVMAGINFAMPEEAENLFRRARKKGIGILAMKAMAFNMKDREATIPSALRYVASRDYVDSVVALMANFKVIRENLESLKYAFSAEDLAILKKNVQISNVYF